jgi:hypothetical protein
MIERERVQAETCACQSRHDHGAAIDCPRSQPAGRRGSHERSRELLIRSGKDASTGVLVTVRDSGPGLNPESLDHLFDALHDQARRHGHGTIDLPFDHHDHRSSRRTVVGYGECTTRLPAFNSPCLRRSLAPATRSGNISLPAASVSFGSWSCENEREL